MDAIATMLPGWFPGSIPACVAIICVAARAFCISLVKPAGLTSKFEDLFFLRARGEMQE
jgi:hypothetical protein